MVTPQWKFKPFRDHVSATGCVCYVRSKIRSFKGASGNTGFSGGKPLKPVLDFCTWWPLTYIVHWTLTLTYFLVHWPLTLTWIECIDLWPRLLSAFTQKSRHLTSIFDLDIDLALNDLDLALLDLDLALNDLIALDFDLWTLTLHLKIFWNLCKMPVGHFYLTLNLTPIISKVIECRLLCWKCDFLMTFLTQSRRARSSFPGGRVHHRLSI